MYCEIKEESQAVLKEHMAKGNLPEAPLHADVKKLTKKDVQGTEILTAGFPCQDIAISGPKLGFSGDRSSLYAEVIKVAVMSKAPFVFLENASRRKIMD